MKTQVTWFGQPPGLTVLFLTEMCETYFFLLCLISLVAAALLQALDRATRRIEMVRARETRPLGMAHAEFS